ncbi:hypothetical protein M2390_001025 [Mycetocola sp. BIGb0189]|uniref:hypothetical protein n=1 Tax=Mycetocola sp. BIGb0189 TaxID=2940604 RepID=UPI002168A60B|nr:hypothetical protein [Mycetocola sp. BIGb0189]MCS4275853.1 hypothetical protein [Mycetocola sp. BIGb0189]
MSAEDAATPTGSRVRTRARLLFLVPPMIPGVIGSLVLALWSPRLPVQVVSQWSMITGEATSTIPLGWTIVFPLLFALLITLIIAVPAFWVIRGQTPANTIAVQQGIGTAIAGVGVVILLSITVLQLNRDGQTWANSVLPILIAGALWCIIASVAAARVRRIIPKLRAVRVENG